MLTFYEVLNTCLLNKELVYQFNRLTGCKLGVDNRSEIIKKVDKATGYQEEVDKEQMHYMDQFVAFVWDCVWLRLPGAKKS